MPTYQYACTAADCGNQFELVQSFTDPAASECPVCGQPVRKVYGSVGVVFKGSGFYRTDSRASSSDGAAKSSEKSSDKSPEKGSSAKSESSSSTGSGSSSGTGSSTPAKAAASA